VLEPALEHDLLTIPEAARRAGISEVALRQRIKRRTQRSIRQGGHLWVAASDVPTAVETVASAGPPSVGTVTTDATLSSTTQAADASTFGTVPTSDVTTLLREQIEGRLRAEQAAAMWQERARNLETQVEQLLALPMHEEEPVRRWWAFWRQWSR